MTFAHCGFTAYYGREFAGYLLSIGSSPGIHLQLKSEERKFALNRQISGMNLAGEFAAVADWIVSEGWLVVGATQAIAFRIITHLTGVVNYSKSTLDALGKLREIEDLTDGYALRADCMRSGCSLIEVRKYSLWASLYFNTLLCVYSGVELMAAITGVVILLPGALNYVLAGGVVSFFAAKVLDCQSRELESIINNIRAERAGYTCFGR